MYIKANTYYEYYFCTLKDKNYVEGYKRNVKRLRPIAAY